MTTKRLLLFLALLFLSTDAVACYAISAPNGPRPNGIPPLRVDLAASEVRWEEAPREWKDWAAVVRENVSHSLGDWSGGNSQAAVPARFRATFKDDEFIFPWGFIPLVQMILPCRNVTVHCEVQFQTKDGPIVKGASEPSSLLNCMEDIKETFINLASHCVRNVVAGAGSVTMAPADVASTRIAAQFRSEAQ